MVKRPLHRVRVPLLKGRGYSIVIGPEAVPRASADLKALNASRAFVLADAALKSHARLLTQSLTRAGLDVHTISVDADESFKEFKKIYPLYGELLKKDADRHSVVFALGGGVIGDAAGFIAGTFLRGIRWVGVPTTLLAQVDSSIGGKTGVNHEAGKNLVGVFHQPSLVLCDTQFLATLPKRELISGLGEIVKYGLIQDPSLFRSVERDWEKLVNLEPRAISIAVARCAKLKAKVVARDERDVTGLREVLNFGHTVGHALEKETGYGYYRHGEAVILGMRAAALLSKVRGHLQSSSYDRIEAYLSQLPVPQVPASVSTSDLVRRVRFDKKKLRTGQVRFVLLSGIGKTVLDPRVTESQIARAIDSIREAT